MVDHASALRAQQRLIVALDYPSAHSALDLVARLHGQCRWFKVGLELFLVEGGSFVRKLRELGFDVFLDLKLHDIPNTVAGAVRSVSTSGASLLTLHASGGDRMLSAAAEAVAGVSDAPKLLAVTVLTSMDETHLSGIGVDVPVEDQVMRLARLAIAAGIPGLVCSPHELTRLRIDLGGEPLLVVPGIRPLGGSIEDQLRVASPAKAIVDGASWLVVGRPITQAPEPAAACASVLAEMADGLASRAAETKAAEAESLRCFSQ